MLNRGILIRIVAPHFVAGLEIEAGVVVFAAPIIGYMGGWDADRVRAYVTRRGWRASIVLERPKGLAGSAGP